MVGFFEEPYLVDDDDSPSIECTNVGSVPGEEYHLQSLQTISGLTLLGIGL